MPVKLNDYSINVKAALNDATIRWLYEAGQAVEARAKRGCKMTPDDNGKLAGSYRYVVDEGKGEALVGSPLESVYWEEFGTGSHAAHGDGRKGWWVYIKDGETRSKKGQTYSSQEEAEAVASRMRKDGFNAYATNGRDPNYTLEKAFKSAEPNVKRRLAELLGEGMK